MFISHKCMSEIYLPWHGNKTKLKPNKTRNPTPIILWKLNLKKKTNINLGNTGVPFGM